MLSTDQDILSRAEAWAKAGKGVAVATVVETWGSAPRPVGSHLVIDEDGTFLGSVSGGCVEGEVVTEALDVIGSGKPRLLEFGVADETAWRAGLDQCPLEQLDRFLHDQLGHLDRHPHGVRALRSDQRWLLRPGAGLQRHGEQPRDLG